MTPMKRRLFLVGALAVAGSALGFVAYGNLGENLVYYWDPGQVLDAGDKAMGASIRLGGNVAPGSVNWDEANNELRFDLTWEGSTVSVVNRGAPPQMFREDIEVLVEGTMTPSGTFQSDNLLVKHDEVYDRQEGVATKEAGAPAGDL